eukprot:scaffold1388_cov267-Chaetoceros_neogracile.AAC.36
MFVSRVKGGQGRSRVNGSSRKIQQFNSEQYIFAHDGTNCVYPQQTLAACTPHILATWNTKATRIILYPAPWRRVEEKFI